MIDLLTLGALTALLSGSANATEPGHYYVPVFRMRCDAELAAVGAPWASWSFGKYRRSMSRDEYRKIADSIDGDFQCASRDSILSVDVEADLDPEWLMTKLTVHRDEQLVFELQAPELADINGHSLEIDRFGLLHCFLPRRSPAAGMNGEYRPSSQMCSVYLHTE